MVGSGPDGAILSLNVHGDESRPSSADIVTSKLVDGRSVLVHTTEQQPPLPWERPSYLNTLSLSLPQVATAFGGPPLTVRILNDKSQLRKELRITAGDVRVGYRDHIVYTDQATAAQAAALGAALKNINFLHDRGAFVVLSKTAAGTDISINMKEATWDRPNVVKAVQSVGQRIAPSVGGLPLTMHLLDDSFQDRRTVRIE